jgi:hypothetical protein
MAREGILEGSKHGGVSAFQLAGDGIHARRKIALELKKKIGEY